MRTKAILVFTLTFYSAVSCAQPLLISCSSERNADNSISIMAESQAYGTYTVKITFSSLLGYSSIFPVINNIAISTAEWGKRELFKFTMDKAAVAYSFQYRYVYFPGRALRKAPDTAFLYLLPAAAGASVRISQVSSLAERLGQKRTDDYFGTGFLYKQGDTICAARAGLAYEANDGMQEGEKVNVIYKTGRNRISIQQRDGSLCTYDILAPIQLLIKPGDIVLPGAPLAIFNKESDKYTVLLSTYYLDEKKLEAPDNGENRTSPACTVYLPIHFYSGENDNAAALELTKKYTAQHPANIIAAELSKKEKKKLGLQ